jgi:hypothetical protein
MRIRSRSSINGVLIFLFILLTALLVLGIVTGKPIFYILFGITLFLIIVSVIGLFTFLRKTAAGSPSVRRSTYDITGGKDLTKSAPAEKEQKTMFCNNCGMKLEAGVTTCPNCGK